MIPNPLLHLLQSRKFLIMLGDVIAATVSLIGTAFLAPQHVETILKLLALWQPVVIVLILAIVGEDNAERVKQAKIATAAVMFKDADTSAKAVSAGPGNSVVPLAQTPEQILAQYGVIVNHNLNETYDLTGANVQFVGMVGIVVTVLRADGTPAVGAPVVINVFPDGHGDEPATPDGAGQVRFSASASSAYTPPQRGPFTVTLCESAAKDPDTKIIHNGPNLSPSIQGMGDYLGNHTLWSLQFREKGAVVPPPPPPPPSNVPTVNNDDELRNLAYGQIYPQGISFLNTAALVVQARKHGLGVACTNEGRFVDPVGRLHDWQGYQGGILHCLDGHYTDADFIVTLW